MTDQEQTELGASTVDRVQATSDRLYKAEFFGRLYLALYVADVQTLCADLERVTAERDAMREVVEAARKDIASGEVDWELHIHKAVARLDATRKATAERVCTCGRKDFCLPSCGEDQLRKATADAAEEGK